MSSLAHSKQERINLRLAQDNKQILERAAALEGKTVSKFILDNIIQKAEQTIAKHDSMVLQEQDALCFFDALSQPIGFNGKLNDALAKHHKQVISS